MPEISLPSNSPDAPAGPDAFRLPRGFTLIEVMVALGLFATAAILTVTILGGSMQAETTVLDQAAAKRVVAAINAKIESMGFAVIQGTSDPALKDDLVQPSGLLFDSRPNVTSTSLKDEKLIFVSRLGDKVGVYSDPIWGRPGTPDADKPKYFEAMLVRSPNPTLSPARESGSDPEQLLLAPSVMFAVRVSWPAYLPDGTPVERSKRAVLVYNFALAR